MLRHVAVFTWVAGIADERVDALATALAALPGRIPEIRSFAFGPDAGLVSGNAQFAVTADFDDEASYLRYAAHPAHQRVLTDLLKPILADRRAVQFEIGADRRNASMSSDR